MEIIIDSNVAFSSLIKGKDSKILRKIIFFSTKIKFVYPEELLIEMHKHS